MLFIDYAICFPLMKKWPASNTGLTFFFKKNSNQTNCAFFAMRFTFFVIFLLLPLRGDCVKK